MFIELCGVSKHKKLSVVVLDRGQAFQMLPSAELNLKDRNV